MRYYDLPEPAYIPAESLLLMGAQPGWSPEREGQRPRACASCGGVVELENGAVVPRLGNDDPLAEFETVAVVCGGCSRSRYDGSSALKRATHADDGVYRPGFGVDPAEDKPARKRKGRAA